MYSWLSQFPLQAHNGMSLFLTMDSPRSSGSEQQQLVGVVEKQVEDQKGHHRRRRKRRHRGHKIIISDEYRNMVIPEIPPFDPKAVQALGIAAVTHNITGDCCLELFERDPTIYARAVLCRSHSVR